MSEIIGEIKVGQRYQCRDPKYVAEIVTIHSSKNTNYPVIAKIYYYGQYKRPDSFTKQGTFYCLDKGFTHYLDLAKLISPTQEQQNIEPECVCPSPSMHIRDCKWMEWKRQQRRKEYVRL